jgi:3-hydroxy-9,10-secoandrosta-1,3,5(10)-triene-9,17-dione monooxygenase reductase component
LILGTLPEGATIMTTRDRSGFDVGLATSSLGSVSLDPPLVSWSLAKNSPGRQAFMNAEYFATHVLSPDQRDLAMRFASSRDGFGSLRLERGVNDIPLLAGCAARLQCRIISRHAGSEHDTFVGEVISFERSGGESSALQTGRSAAAPGELDTSGAADRPSSDIGRNSITHLMARAYYQLRLGIRPELARSNLSEAEYYILAAVALIGPCSVGDVIDTIGVSGHLVNSLDVKRLAQRHLVTFVGGAGDQVALAEPGREIVLRMALLSKSVEADAVTDMSDADIEAFKQMLRKMIRRTRVP